MSSFGKPIDLKIGDQTFLIDDYICVRKLSNYNLYAVQYCYEVSVPLFFISAYFAGLLLTKEFVYSDGLLKIGGLKKLLETRKVVFKNCYYELAFKNSKEIAPSIMKVMTNNQNIFDRNNYS